MVAPQKQDTRFRLPAGLAKSLADTFGTPLYVMDEAHLRSSIRRYRNAFESCRDRTELVYASKANSALAILAIAAEEGCLIDVASEGELRAAMLAGVPPGRCHLHGNNKQREELEFALESGIGQIVVDHFGEIEMLAELLQGASNRPDILVRLAPGVDPVTHSKISTGQADTKFGFNIGDGSAERAVVRCLELGLPLIGFHCHVGSQLLDPKAQRSAGEIIAAFAVAMMERHGLETRVLNVGGGLGVRYVEGDEPMPVEEYSRLIVNAVASALDGSGLDPVLAQEPGRALVAESGVSLYKVGVVKTVPSPGHGLRTYVSVDGGMSDNPRPALYGSRYTVERVWPDPGPVPTIRVTVSGKHCEADRLFDGVQLPEDVAPGDLLQVLCTGAYGASMASNYNRYPRPAMVMIDQSGRPRVVQRRETWDQMFGREELLGGGG